MEKPPYFQALLKDIEKGGYEHRIRFQDPQADLLSKNIYRLRKRIKSLVRDLNRSLSTEEQLQEYLRELITFQELIRQVGPVRDVDNVMAAILSVASEILKSEHLALYLCGTGGERWVLGKALDSDWFVPTLERDILGKQVVDGVEREPFAMPFFAPSGQEEGSLLVIPLHSGKQLLGMLFCYLPTSHLNFFQYHFNLFGLFGHNACTALENAILFERIQDLSSRDDLTKLHNSRFLRQYLEAQCRLATPEAPLALFFLDVDCFKGVNDSFGHLVGSRVLAEVANLLRDFALAGCACRYGGDEFVLALPHTDRQRAENLAEDLRFRLEVTQLLKEDYHISITISVGVALFPNQALSVEELLHHADMAMYQAKAGGKNRVEIWRGP